MAVSDTTILTLLRFSEQNTRVAGRKQEGVVLSGHHMQAGVLVIIDEKAAHLVLVVLED